MKKWMKRGAALCVAATMVVAGAGCAKKVDPKEAVISAFKGVAEDKTVKPFEEITGISQLLSAKTNNETGYSLRLDSSSDATINQMAGLGIEMSSKVNREKKQGLLNMGIQYGGNSVVTGNIYVADNQLKASLPELSNSLFTMNMEDLAGQIANGDGYLAKMIREQGGLTEDDLDTLQNAVEGYATTENTSQLFDLPALWKRYKEGSKAIENLKAAMEVSEGDSLECEVDGKQQKCKGYQVVIPKGASVEFVKSTSDFFLKDETLKKDMITYWNQMKGAYASMNANMTGEEMQQEAWKEVEEQVAAVVKGMEENMGDLTMTVYLTKAGKLAAVNASVDITGETEDDKVNVDLDLKIKGGSYTTQNMDAILTLSEPQGEAITFSLMKQGTYDKKNLTSDISLNIKLPDGQDGQVNQLDFVYTGTYDVESGDYHVLAEASGAGEQIASLSVIGVINDLEKGKSMDVYMDSIDVNVRGEKVAGMSGHVYIKPLEGEIEEPTGTSEIDIMAASQSDWANVGNEIIGHAVGILSSLGMTN